MRKIKDEQSVSSRMSPGIGSCAAPRSSPAEMFIAFTIRSNGFFSVVIISVFVKTICKHRTFYTKRHITYSMKQRNTETDNGIPFFIAAGLYVLHIVFNSPVKEGMISSFMNCVEYVLPSVFPALILTTLMTYVGMPKGIKKITEFFIEKIFGVPKQAAQILFYGLIAGYPAGIKTAVTLRKEKICSARSAKTAGLIATNPGIAFTILTLGKQTSSPKLGALLYLAVTFSQIVCSFFLRKKNKAKEAVAIFQSPSKDFRTALTQAVSSSVNACISFTSWITAFGIISGLTSLLPLQSFQKLLSPFLEVTQATSVSLVNHNYPATAFSLGFGGLCVFFQLLPDMVFLGISPAAFLLFRLANGLLAAGIMALFSFIFPASVTAAVYTISPLPTIHTFGEVFSLFFFCVIFMFGLANKLSVC